MGAESRELSNVEVICVNTAEFIDDGVIEVKGWLDGGGRVPREYTVHFTRRGAIKFGQWWVPDCGYLAPKAIPLAVKEAAMTEYQKGRT